jgi:hypothetical protein
MVALVPGHHQRVADDEVLRRRSRVSAGRTIENVTEGEKGSRRCARSPGSYVGAQDGRGRTGAAGMFAGVQWPWRRNDDLGVDWSVPKLIPCTGTKRKTHRFFEWPHLGEGAPIAMARSPGGN